MVWLFVPIVAELVDGGNASEKSLTSGSHCENLTVDARHKTRRSRAVLARASGREGQPRILVRCAAQSGLENSSGNETSVSQCRFGRTEDPVQYRGQQIPSDCPSQLPDPASLRPLHFDAHGI